MNSMRGAENHPISEMNRLVRGSATRTEQSLAVQHLLAGCSSCSEHVAREVGWENPLSAAGAEGLQVEDEVARKGAERIEAVLNGLSVGVASWVETVRGESREISSLAAAVAEGSIADPRPQIEALTARQRRNLCSRLLEQSVAARLEDPKVTLRCAEQAVAILSDGLADEAAGDLAELRVRGWSELGNARRISNDLVGSEAAFTIAAECLDQVPQCDPLLKAEFLSLLASLRDYQRRTKDALALVRQAAVIYERHGSDDAVAKIRIKEAALLATVGDVEEGLQAVKSGLQRMGPDSDPSLLVAGLHNFVHLLVDRGSYGEAAHLIEAVEPLYRRFAGRIAELRLDWLKARIDLETKGPDAGTRALEAIRRRFQDEDLAFETALVSLELAQIYARTGNVPRLRETAEIMLPIFVQLGVTRDLIAAVTTLRAAGAREEATLAIIERLRHGLGGEGGRTL